MSAPGHCRHCQLGPNACAWRESKSIPDGELPWPHHSAHASWNDKRCPACDVAERIVSLLVDAERNARQDEVIGLRVALELVRGDA